MAKGNIRKFDEFELTLDEQKEAIGYVCYERVIYYLFKYVYHLDYFCLFYLDRFWGWKYGESQEPIIPSYNGFEQFLDREIYVHVKVPKGDIIEYIRLRFESSAKLFIPVWVKHYSDGTPYITPIILEGMDENGFIYYSKHTAVDRSCCKKLSKEDFLSMLAPDDNNFIDLSIIKESEELRRMKNMNYVQRYHHIFYDIYKYDFNNNMIIKDDKALEIDLSGFDNFIDDIKDNPTKILTSDGIPKHQQFRLYIHINNKIRPIQNIIKSILENKEIKVYLPNGLREELQVQYDTMDKAISEVLKFASLVFQKQNTKCLDLYVKCIMEIRQNMISYHNANLELTRWLLTLNIC